MRRFIDDGEQAQRCGAARASNTTAAGAGPSLQTRRSVTHPQLSAAELARIEQLRQVAVHLEAADLLECRADRADDPALAALQRERAAAHRRRAERLRAG